MRAASECHDFRRVSLKINHINRLFTGIDYLEYTVLLPCVIFIGLQCLYSSITYTLLFSIIFSVSFRFIFLHLFSMLVFFNTASVFVVAINYPPLITEEFNVHSQCNDLWTCRQVHRLFFSPSHQTCRLCGARSSINLLWPLPRD